ncbi:MAG: hypothetical protein UHM23_06855 [Clostridia bacterium]|nr:hypothetical protein [Clostridia bacterium]
MLAGFLGFFIGTIFGAVMICCFTVASEADDQMEKDFKKMKENDNKADSE